MSDGTIQNRILHGLILASMNLYEETYHRLGFPQPFINVVTEDAHTTDNIINMASTPRVLVATGFVYSEMKCNSSLRLYTTDHFLLYTSNNKSCVVDIMTIILQQTNNFIYKWKYDNVSPFTLIAAILLVEYLSVGRTNE